MATASELVLQITAKNDASAALNSVGADLKKVSGAADAVSFAVINRGIGQMGDAASSLGGKLSGLTGSSSDLNESLSKSNIIFQDGAKEIEDWASGAAKDFGLSKSAALDAAGSFGNMFSQLGIGSQEAAKMSTGITELAADFASFHNADISEVVTAQSAAFRGEYDALQRFLPLINAATVEQKAMEMTGKATNKELTAQEKALAVNALMFEGAGEAMGDFDRTATGLANSQRILTATQEDMAASMGSKVVPIQQAMLGLYQEMPGAVQTAGAVVSIFGADAVTMAGGLGQAVLGLKAFGPALSALGPALAAVRTGIMAMGAAMLTPPLGIVIALAAVAVAAYVFRDDILAAFGAAKDFIVGVAGEIAAFLSSTWGSIVAGAQSAWAAVTSSTSEAWAFVKNTVAEGVNSSIAFMSALPGALLGLAQQAFNGFIGVLTGLPGAVLGIAEEVVGSFISVLGRLPGEAAGLASEVIGAMTGALAGLPGALWDAGRNAVQGLVNGLNSIDVGSVAAGIANKATFGLTGALGIRSPSTVFHGLGKDTIQGLIDGINAMDDEVRLAMSDTVRIIGNALNREVFEDMSIGAGLAIPLGLAEGIEAGRSPLKQALDSTLDEMRGALRAAEGMGYNIPAVAYHQVGEPAPSSGGEMYAALAHARQMGYTLPPGFQHGTSHVPRTGLAMLHKGEAVIPASQNRGGHVELHVHLENSGTIVGIANAEQWVGQAVRNVMLRGGLDIVARAV